MDQISELNRNVDKVFEKIHRMEDELKNLREELSLEKESKQAFIKTVHAKEDLLKEESSENETKLEEALLNLNECNSKVNEYRERLVSKKVSLENSINDAKQNEERRKPNGNGGGVTKKSQQDLLKIRQGGKQLEYINEEIEAFK